MKRQSWLDNKFEYCKVTAKFSYSANFQERSYFLFDHFFLENDRVTLVRTYKWLSIYNNNNNNNNNMRVENAGLVGITVEISQHFNQVNNLASQYKILNT